MRITSGKYKGRQIKTPKDGSIIRPAMSQVREAIFSSLGSVEGLHFLDVFAGTGVLGFEALSRGAAFVSYVDQHPQALRLILLNAENLDCLEQVHVYKRRLPHGLGKLDLSRQPDVIFCDPPYDRNLLNPTLKSLVADKLIDPDSWLIIEHSPREEPDLTLGPFVCAKRKTYGQTIISTLQLSPRL